MKKLWIVLFMFLAAGFLTGCTEKQQIAPEPLCLSGLDSNSAMQASERVLVGMNFVIDKADPNISIMTTKPLAGAQFFELWRKDNVGKYNTAMSNLHSIQRTVELGFSGKQNELCVSCIVRMERLSIPEKEIDSSARAYSMFSRSASLKQSLALNTKQEEMMSWVDLGRDNRLETVILNKINKEISKNKDKK